MSSTIYRLIYATISEIHESLEYNNLPNDINIQHSFRIEMIIANKTLSKEVKSQMVKMLVKCHDYNKIIFNKGAKRSCENCDEECLAILYCEYCIRRYLQANFSSWTSNNIGVDNLIQECQIESISPNRVVEWIPYDNLQNIRSLTGKAYSADWVNGYYDMWDVNKRQLQRSGTEKVILKRVENIESANKVWFKEAKSNFNTSNKWNSLVKYHGITKDQLGYMVVMKELDMNLKNYLQNNILTWKEIIKIIQDIINALVRIHEENLIHKNLHSRNVLFLKDKNQWYIGDLGFCGPTDKPLGNIYGTLPYMAPEVITGKEHDFASDIYSLAMLMWEISSGYPPFANYEYNDFNFVNDIINGMRPEIIPGTPIEYRELMEQCWNADPIKRPDIFMLRDKINEMMDKAQQTVDYYTNRSLIHICSVNSLFRSFNSKIYNIMDLNEPRNNIEAYTSIQTYSSIPNNFMAENRMGQFDSPILIDDDDDVVEVIEVNEVNKPKRVYVDLLGDDDDVIFIGSKKAKYM